MRFLRRLSNPTAPIPSRLTEAGSGTVAELAFQLKVTLSHIDALVNVATQVPGVESAGVPLLMIPEPVSSIADEVSTGSVSFESVSA